MKDECSADTLPPLVMKGIEEFNRGEFFEQHEAFETAWRAEPRPVRELYQGILQVGVACYHLERGNLPGAQKALERGLRKLRRFTPECLGIDVARLIAEAEQLREEALRLRPERLEALNKSLFPRIVVRESPEPT